MSKDLEDLRRILIEGQRRSMQGSYMRRNPARKAIPFLHEARSKLKEYVEEHDQDPEGWRLLSQAEECFLNYAAARRCLERAVSLCQRRDRKDLKRLALLKEYDSQRLPPAKLVELGDYLRPRLRENGCDHTFRFTEEWLESSAYKERVSYVLDELRNQGACCDCEVLRNVVTG
jgi:hypothetical protein